jgi:hypothetical protein
MDILSTFPDLIDGFIPAFLSTQDGTLENLPDVAKSALNKIIDCLQEVLVTKKMKIPQLEFYEMEYVSVSWIRQETIHLATNHILPYAVSLNHKPLFDFITTNTVQSEATKMLTFSAIAKNADKISEDNREHFIEYIISWIEQDITNLTNENILPYAVSLNHKPLFDLITTNISQSETAKLLTLSAIIKNINKISEDNRKHFMQYCNPINPKFYIPISITAYATGNINSIKYLNDEKLNYIIDNINLQTNSQTDYKLQQNKCLLSSILPIILENPKSKLIEIYKNKLIFYVFYIIQYKRIDLLKEYIEIIKENYNKSRILVQCTFREAMKNNIESFLFILKESKLQNLIEEINTKQCRSTESPTKLLEEMKKLLDNNIIHYTLYEIVYDKISQATYKEDTKQSISDNEMKAMLSNKIAYNSMKIIILDVKYHNAKFLQALLQKSQCEEKASEVLNILIEAESIDAAAEWIELYNISDNIICTSINELMKANERTDLKKFDKILDKITHKEFLKYLDISRLKEDQIINYYHKYINDIYFIPDIVYSIILCEEDPYFRNKFRVIAYLSQLI